MRVMELGDDGMLGHQLVASLASVHEIHATFRRTGANDGAAAPANGAGPRKYFGVDALDWAGLQRLIRDVRPGAVLNAIGVIKQRDTHKDAILNIELNALLPH